MEEEINYSTMVFKNDGAASNEKNEDIIYSEVKPKEAATTEQTEGDAASHCHFPVLVTCVGSLCVLLLASTVVIIYISLFMNKQTANMSDLTAENKRLIVETGELSRAAQNLNWTLARILKFNTFPVDDYCPEKNGDDFMKQCQPCRKDWILFQEKCYLFYEENAPWKTWEDSRMYCLEKAADLVVIDNLHEQEFISNSIKYYYSIGHGYWLGLKESKDRNWVWVDGRNDTLRFWLTEDLGDSGLYALIIPRRNRTANWDPAQGRMSVALIFKTKVFTERRTQGSVRRAFCNL